MKTKLKKARNMATTLLIAAVFAAGLSGCGESASVEPKPEIPATQVTTTADPSPTSAPAETEPTETETPSAAGPAAPSPEDESVYSADAAPAEQEPAEPEMGSVEAVAGLGDLVGMYSASYKYARRCTVDCEDAHNPYDLVWAYGDPGKQSGAYGKQMARSWGSLYQGYVDACDWSLVFDADYYKKAFPMLAVLYHDDDALLLEHFQTRGVHEGRQASAAFNVSAYMANCGEDLRSAFGEDYECYYFYYMLNHGTEQGVSTRNDDGSYPLWRTVEMSSLQSDELRMTNKLREEAGNGAEPVEPDPELMALACYRAWNDSVNHVEAHDWLDYHTADAVRLTELMSLEHGWSENTVKQYSTLSPKYWGHWINYKNSKSHYGAMVNPGYLYMGVSNVYVQPLHDDAGNMMTSEFEVYTAARAHAPESLD